MSTEDSISKVAAASQKLVAILSSLSTTEGRQKALASAMAIFGEALPPVKTSNEPDKKMGQHDSQLAMDGICLKAVGWMNKNQITQEQLEHVFSIDADAIEIIASKMPAKERTVQVVQAYILCGIAAFLKTGDLGFLDEDARKFCEKAGCYKKDNHSKSFKIFGNSISGSKNTGWRITNPGLVEGAKVIKLLTPKTSE
jgi:hypothetical protein